MDEIISMARKFKRLRENKMMTQDDVAQELHVSRSCYQAYEAGTREPSRANLLKLAEIFETPLGILMDDSTELIEPDKLKESPYYGRRKGDDSALLNLAHNMTYREYWDFYTYGCWLITRRESNTKKEYDK